MAALFVFASCSAAKAQSAFPPDMVKAFAEAGIPLLRERAEPGDFSLPLAGAANTAEEIRLASLKGKVVFLNFWATWCGPCRAEMPSMESLYRRYKDKGLEILAVNCQEQRRDVDAFMAANKLSFPAVLDTSGEVSAVYGIQAIPSTFLLDREGKIVARLIGSTNWDTPAFHAALERLLELK